MNAPPFSQIRVLAVFARYYGKLRAQPRPQVVVDPEAKSLDRHSEALRAFHLTAAETRVAALVAEGLGTRIEAIVSTTI